MSGLFQKGGDRRFCDHLGNQHRFVQKRRIQRQGVSLIHAKGGGIDDHLSRFGHGITGMNIAADAGPDLLRQSLGPGCGAVADTHL